MLKSFEFGASRFGSVTSLFALATALGGCAADQVSSEDLETNAQAIGDETNLGTIASKIIGGSKTTAFPAVGALIFDPQTGPGGQVGYGLCTATVIAPRVILTAAHCLVGIPISKTYFTVQPVVGNDRIRMNATLAKSIRVSRAVPHPNYDDQQITNDIGVAILESDAPATPIPYNTTSLDSILGPTTSTSPSSKQATFVGYGVTNGFTNQGSGTKRTVTLPIRIASPTLFSFGGTRGGRNQGTCFGDSGGPALLTNARNETVVVGVTSFGNQYCTGTAYDTRVDAYSDFIRDASRL